MKHKFLATLIFLVFSILKLEGSQKDYHFYQFLKNNVSWISECNEEKVYLKPDMIRITSEGIKIVDEYLREFVLSELFSNEKGIYTNLASLKTTLAYKIHFP